MVVKAFRRRADFAHHDRYKEIRMTYLKLGLYSFKFDPIDCLRYLLLEFFDILDGCLCYSAKLYGGTNRPPYGHASAITTLRQAEGPILRTTTILFPHPVLLSRTYIPLCMSFESRTCIMSKPKVLLLGDIEQ